MVRNWVSNTQFCAGSGALNGIAACPQQGAGPAGFDGTVRQNSLDAPGRRDIDASIFRDFPIWERVRFQIRGEATNVASTSPISRAPNGTLNSTTFGQITNVPMSGSTFGNRNIIQVGGRILL